MRLQRDSLLLVGGLLGVGYETVFENVDRPELLILFGAMMGLPIVLNADERRNGKKK